MSEMPTSNDNHKKDGHHSLPPDEIETSSAIAIPVHPEVKKEEPHLG